MKLRSERITSVPNKILETSQCHIVGFLVGLELLAWLKCVDEFVIVEVHVVVDVPGGP